MGEWGPTATDTTRLQRWRQLSRWGNGGQPQRSCAAGRVDESLADGGMGANRNGGVHLFLRQTRPVAGRDAQPAGVYRQIFIAISVT